MKNTERHRIRLPALKRLYWRMKRADRMRVQFDYTHPNNGQVFVVMFLADTDPYQLVLATKGLNPFVAIFSINTEFEVDPWVKDVGRLMDLLGVSRAPRIPGKSPWRLTQFLREVTASAPKDVGAAKDASPAELARIHRDVDEADKIYFLHFVNHGSSGRHCSLPNLDKTRRLLGESAYKLCRDQNLSSAWSADPSDENAYRASVAKIVDENPLTQNDGPPER